MAGELAGDHTPELLGLVHDIAGMCAGSSSATPIAADALFRKDCTDLVRRISLLTYLFEEIRELHNNNNGNNVVASASSSSSSSSAASWSSDLVVALHSARSLLSVARNFRSNCSSVSFLIYSNVNPLGVSKLKLLRLILPFFSNLDL